MNDRDQTDGEPLEDRGTADSALDTAGDDTGENEEDDTLEDSEE